MPRWEHGSEERLKKAAIELFEEQGFENTSVIEISERGSGRSGVSRCVTLPNVPFAMRSSHKSTASTTGTAQTGDKRIYR
jgi:hypothetical protein